MTGDFVSGADGLSLRSRPKVAGILPLLKMIDNLNHTAAEIEIDMAMGENWLIREPLVEISRKMIAEGFTTQDLSYPQGMGGTAPLLSAFAGFFNRYFHPRIPIRPEHMITFAGASICLDAVIYATCDEGDSILLPAPFWGGYGVFTKLRADVNILSAGGLPFRSALSVDIVDMVRNAYSSALNPKRIKALLITNPHNPIGSYYTPSVLRDLMRFCEDKKLHYISDEVYAMSAFGGVGDDHFTSGLALVADEETSPMDPRRLHVIYSMSKDFGCAGIRMGISPRNRTVLEGSMLANYLQVSVFNSRFVTSVLTDPHLPDILTNLKYQLKQNYNLLVQAFQEWAVDFLPTTAGFHVYARLAKTAQSWDAEAYVAKQLLDLGVMITPGKSFGGIDGEVGWFRISFSVTEEKLKIGIERIGKVLSLLT